MWMSELSTRSGLPVPTVKYYLREHLLHPGEAVGATRARYDDSHVRRLRLVRALTEVAHLRLEDVRRVLDAIDDPHRSLHEAVGSAHTRLPTTVAADLEGSERSDPASRTCCAGTTGSWRPAARTARPWAARWPR